MVITAARRSGVCGVSPFHTRAFLAIDAAILRACAVYVGGIRVRVRGDFRERQFVSCFASQSADANSLGTVEGEKTHALATDEGPKHTHTLLLCDGGAGAGSSYAQVSKTKADNILQTTNSAGSGAAHNNMQPSLHLNYIVKV